VVTNVGAVARFVIGRISGCREKCNRSNGLMSVIWLVGWFDVGGRQTCLFRLIANHWLVTLGIDRMPGLCLKVQR